MSRKAFYRALAATFEEPKGASDICGDAAQGGTKLPRKDRRRRVYQGRALRPGNAAAKRGKHRNCESFDERLERAAKRNAEADERPKFRMLAPKIGAGGADLRDVKATKRRAQIQSRKKGLIGPNEHIGSKCI